MRGGGGPLAESLKHRTPNTGVGLQIWSCGQQGAVEGDGSHGSDAIKHALFLTGNFWGSQGGEGHFPLHQRA